MIKKTEFNKSVRVHSYGYRPSKLHERGFHVVKKIEGSTTYQPVGDYVPLQTSEDKALSERKVINLVSVLNEDELLDLSTETNAKTLFQLNENSLNDEEDETETSSGSVSGSFIMRVLKEEGTSIPDAMISFSDTETLEKFKSNIKRYCASLSATAQSFRAPALYGLVRSGGAVAPHAH